ncbi:hypothetical protein TWF730_001653 [Orbilia blumenaviensis]|uniref:Uncharacterized protein n=1 Tax=Orbilia blumenaviensis TaxID=1796055 RepID=A0AAV9UIJ7_9PEZI
MQRNLRQSYQDPSGSQGTLHDPSNTTDAAQAAETNRQTNEWVDRTTAQSTGFVVNQGPNSASSTPSLDLSEPPNVGESTKPNTESVEAGAAERPAQSSELQDVEAEDIIYFVNTCLNDAVWWLENRLVFGEYLSVPGDAFELLFDNPEEGLQGYGFLTEERNKDITCSGFFNILKSYAEQASGRPPVPANSLPLGETDPQSPNVLASQVKKKKFKKWSLSWGRANKFKKENKKATIKQECDRIASLLGAAGYLPDPSHVPTIKELHSGQFPDPVQYHLDVQYFLELILCALFMTCQQVLDVDDILRLTFTNNEGGYRTLRYENKHLVILSLDPRSDRVFRTLIPIPLSRLILIYLIDIRPFIAFLNTDEETAQKHWYQEYLFPARAGGCWTKERMNEVMRVQTKRALGVGSEASVEDLRAIYRKLKVGLGDGWIDEIETQEIWGGKTMRKVEMAWSKELPEGEAGDGGQRYLMKHFESAKLSPIQSKSRRLKGSRSAER